MFRIIARVAALFAAAMLACIPLPAKAQSTSQAIYGDALENGWQNWSWATVNLSNTSPVHSGHDSISVTAGPWQALYLANSVQYAYNFDAVTFWINGGPVGGQKLQVLGLASETEQTAVPIGPLEANTWQQITIPLSALGIAGRPDFDGIWIEDSTGTTQPTFYVDDISLTPGTTPPPTSASLTVDAAAPIRTIDSRMFGINTGIWDSLLSSPSTLTLANDIGLRALRYPGGDVSQEFDWTTDKTTGDSDAWVANPGLFGKVVQSTGASAYVTANYGSGTPQMAAAWVAWANASPSSTTAIGIDSMGRNWHTAGYWASLRAASPLAVDDGYNFLRLGQTTPLGFVYWEIGNEDYGTWETDLHGTAGSGLIGVAHDPTTYANAFAQFVSAMRAVDPNIKIGAIAITGEDSYSNGLNPVPNPAENNELHSGWTPVMLATFKKLGVTPDFLFYHRYPQANGDANDYVALYDASLWNSDAANLRMMLTDYMGTAGNNVELDATEQNLISDTPVKETTSLVGGLYYAESFGSLAATEFNANLWYTLHNGSVDDGDPTEYGWREFADFGILASGDRSDTPANTPYPTYYGAKLCDTWTSPGDTVLTSTSDDPELAIHAVRKQNGHMALLVVNKSPETNITGDIALSGFSPAGSATTYSYGETNDTSQTGLTTSTTVAGSAFSYTFPAYSMTVIDMPFGHTFGAGLQMVSAPGDYTGDPLGSLLGTGTKACVWDPAKLEYDITPTAPADTFHLGTGYWVDLSASATITSMGTVAPAGVPYSIALSPGWNMIGDPFASPVGVGTLTVEDSSAQAATSTTPLAIYGYSGGKYVEETASDSLEPYVGYWIYVPRVSTLVVPAPS